MGKKPHLYTDIQQPTLSSTQYRFVSPGLQHGGLLPPGNRLRVIAATADKRGGREKGGDPEGPLHSVIVKWELSFWISYFNANDRSCELFIRQTVCRCFLPCTTRSRLSLALALRSLFSKTENPALILTGRSCIQNSA